MLPLLSAAFLLAAPPEQPTKVVLVAGSNYFKPGEHEYVAGCKALADLLVQTPGIKPEVVLDWPTKPETFAGAKAILFYFDGGDKHLAFKGDHAAEVQKLVDAGVGLIMLHQGPDVPKDLGDRMRGWSGAAWEKGYSQRAHWVYEYKDFPEHPIFRGVTPFKIDDGYLYKLRFVDGQKGIAPLLKTPDPKAKAKQSEADKTVAWAFERPGGGRSFTFTGTHLHASLAQEGYRRFLVNGILWTAGVDVPKDGAKVELKPGQLDGYLAKKAK